MKTIIKKTSELTEHEIQSFLNCHDNVFEGHGTTVDSFKCMYNNTCVGYSIISLLLDNNENVCGGMFSSDDKERASPRLYEFVDSDAIYLPGDER